VVVKTLFVGHILCLFTAFILMNKNKLLTSYLHNNLLLNENDREIADRNPELLAFLTDREYTVLELIAKGFKDQEIADRLFISVSTVKSHKQKIYKKLEISSKSQATKIYFNFNIKAMNFLNN
jgi:DNA-binding NarL/FixJ family response regulator